MSDIEDEGVNRIKKKRRPTLSRRRSFELGVTHESGVTSSIEQEKLFLIIIPHDPRKVAWDILVGGLIIYSVIAVPFRTGFRVEDNFALIVSDGIIDSLFGIDIILSFRTAVPHEEGGFETNPWLIASDYFRGFFWIDFISTVPFKPLLAAIGSSKAGNVAALGKLLKILRLARLMKLLRIMKIGKMSRSPEEDPPAIGPSMMAMLKMIAILYFIAHQLACLWFMILDEDKEVNWLNRFGSEIDFHKSLGLFEKYVISLYWAFTTMTTVGYGDIAGTTTREYMICLFAMVVGASVFAYVMCNVSAISELLDPKTTKYSEKMERINLFIADRKIPPSLANQIKGHFKHMYHKTTVFDVQAQIMLDLIPASVSAASAYVNYAKVVEALPFFQRTPPMLVKEFLESMVPFKAAPRDYIHWDNDLGLCVFMLKHGTAKRYISVQRASDKDAHFEHFDYLHAGSLFGDASVILNSKQYVTTIAYTECELWYIPKGIFLEKLSSWPQVRSKLAKDGRNFLERVRTSYQHYHHKDCPSLDDMLRYAEKEDTEDGPLKSMGIFDQLALHPQAVAHTCIAGNLPFDQKMPNLRTLSDIDEAAKAASPKGKGKLLRSPSGASMSSFGSQGEANPRRPSGRKRIDSADLEPHRAYAESVEEQDDGDDEDDDDLKTNEELLKESMLINPDASPKMFWDMFISMIILYSVVTLAFQIGFSVELNFEWFLVDAVVNVFFAIDILVTFNTAIEDEDFDLICDRQWIAQKYLKGWFTIDFVSTVPFLELFELIKFGGDSSAFASLPLIRSLRLVRLVKIARVLKMNGMMDALEKNMGLRLGVINLFKLFMLMLLFSHLLACCLYAVADCQNQECWVERYCVGSFLGEDAICLDSMDRTVQYKASLYYAFATMTTIGYGDISPSPHSTTEIAFGILAEVLGTMIFAYVIRALVILIIKFDRAANLRSQNLAHLNEYLTDFNCTLSFRRCLRTHFLYREKIKSVFDENLLLSLMPPGLRKNVFRVVNSTRNTPLPLFTRLELEYGCTLSVVFPLLKPYSFIRHDLLVSSHIANHREMFFISLGVVSVLNSEKYVTVQEDERSRKSFVDGFKKFYPQDYFGEVMLLMPGSMEFQLKVDVRAVTVVQCFGLDAEALKEIIYPELLAKFKEALRPSFEKDMDQWVDITPPVSPQSVIDDLWPSGPTGTPC